MSPEPASASFLDEMARLFGPERVVAAPAAEARYGPDTSTSRRRIAGAVRPLSTEDVVQVVTAANRHGVPIYPISTGHNWGYGTANPVRDGCIIVDLSGMDQIVAVEPDLGIITLQPGVTQGRLKQYLDERGLELLVPVHGGGPGCSIVGNALERGYGITPIADHFLAVMSLTAVLPNGEVYRPALDAAGATTAARVFKWGVGPYLDGLFTQSNFGIVTEMTIALARRPELVEAFYFWITEDSALEQAIERVRQVLRTYPGVVGGINLMDERRLLSMMVPYPRETVPPGEVMPPELVKELGRSRQVPAWLGIGALYGDARVVRAAKGGVRSLLRPISRRLTFMTMARAQRLRRLLRLLPAALVGREREAIETVIQGQAVFEGNPTQVALRLAYWKSGRPMPEGDIDPARDGCGLLWYSPLVPMRPDTVRRYVDTVRDVCPRHGLEPLITLTSVSERCFDSTVPLLFDGRSDPESQGAEACYRELLEAGRTIGCFPYRFGTDSMGAIVDPKVPFWRLAAAFKRAVDPGNILAPGRYALDG